MVQGQELAEALNALGRPKHSEATDFWRATGFHALNRYVSSGDDPILIFGGKRIDLGMVAKQLDEALAQSPRLGQPALVWRGTRIAQIDPTSVHRLNPKEILSRVVGRRVFQSTYLSTTWSYEKAEKHALEHLDEPLVLRIELPPGMPMLWFGWRPGSTLRAESEDEILLPRGCKLLVDELVPGSGEGCDQIPPRLHCRIVR
jgi:ADP-ribosyltransferase exoenzyme